MLFAVALDLAERRVSGAEVAAAPEHAWQLVCAGCRRPVHLVRRVAALHFAHVPGVPAGVCSWRVDHPSGPARSSTVTATESLDHPQEPVADAVASPACPLHGATASAGELDQCSDCRTPICPACRVRCERCAEDLCADDAQRHLEWSCPDCGQSICETAAYGLPNECIVCGDEVCGECYHGCEACGESVCDDCCHGEGACEACGNAVCEHSEEQAEECTCGSTYCWECADEHIQPCPGCAEAVCADCGEECEECGARACSKCCEAHAAGHDAAESS